MLSIYTTVFFLLTFLLPIAFTWRRQAWVGMRAVIWMHYF
jgi:hypothetical protein